MNYHNNIKFRRKLMLLGLAGVTGVGKSHFKDKITERLNFDKIKIITNREIRSGEKNNVDKIFVSDNQLAELKEARKNWL